MSRRAYQACILIVALGFACGEARARGFGGGYSGAIAAATYGGYYNQSLDSNMFAGPGFTPYGAEGTGASRAPIGVYGANQTGGSAGNPVGAYSGYPAGIGSGGGGLRDFADFPAGSSAASGSAYMQTSSAWSQGAGWGTGNMTRFPTDVGLSDSSAATPGAAAHSTLFMSRSAMASQARAVRSSFRQYDSFSPAWYAANPRAWAFAAGSGLDAWASATPQALAGWCGISGPPQYLDYGNNVVLANGHVFVNGADVGTAEQYSQQASALAEQGRTATTAAGESWMPLGVFALAQGTEGTSNQLYQLAMDKNGIIRGNFYEPGVETNAVVYGKADKTSMRAAWCVGDSKKVVFETGLFNLTSLHTPLLVHFGTEKTQQWLLVRLEKPQASTAGK